MEKWLEQDEHQLAADRAESQVPVAQSNSLVIAAEGEASVLSRSYISEPLGSTAWRSVGNADDSISRLNSLLSAVPALALAGDVASTQYMAVTCSNALIGAKDRLGEVIPGALRAFSVGPSGITEQAVLFSPDRLAAMVNVSALINVASIALAQKHLADISQKLSEIRSSVDGIRRFQNEQRRSKLTGSIRYFEQIAPSVLEGERPERVLNQIEHHEAELLEVYEHVIKEIRSELEEVSKVTANQWFGTGKTNSTIEMHQQRVVELFRDLILCLRARGCGWQLLCLFPGEEKGKAYRRQDIQTSIDELSTDGAMLVKSEALLRSKIHDMSSLFSLGTTTNARKLALLRANETLLAEVSAARTEVQDGLYAAEEMLTALKKPVTMAVRVDSGRIVAIKAL